MEINDHQPLNLCIPASIKFCCAEKYVFLFSESIMQELNVLQRRPVIEYCKAEGESKIRRETILPLVMYYIEQQHNFSGEGIWLHHEAEENKTRVLK